MKKYEIHEYAALVPMAVETEQRALTLDIKENGLREPIILWKGKIVDGRCRQEACVVTGEKIRTKELDDSLTDMEVKAFVKSVNTRRNLTTTQKAISACKETLALDNKLTGVELAEAWGISLPLLNNAKFVAKHQPHFIQPLFNGEAVSIVNQNGKAITTNKVSTVYAYVKRLQEAVVEDNEHGWDESAYINTQAGKDWYYDQIKNINLLGTNHTQHLIAELANYKFHK